MQPPRTTELPDFIIKSTLGVSITVLLLLIPFTFLSFIQGRYLIGGLMAVIQLLCIANIWVSLKNQYSNSLNLFAIFILIITTGIGLYQLEILASYWPSLAVLALYFVLPQKQAWIVNILYVSITIPIAWHVLDPAIAARFVAVLLGISFFAFSATHEIYKQHYLLKEQSVTDILTGLYNRSLLQSSLENAIHQSDRSKTNMAILMLDIDHFKTINDRFGHDVGDAVLKSTGKFLSKFFRAGDVVFRIGGEEFLALIYNTDKTNATSVAEKLRQEFEQLPLINNHDVTISIGVSDLQPNMDWKQWMKQGDENLYKAKANGRNQVFA
ncbi:MAG: sensor domain-containing diguanylate cyclase [Methylophaga sp.]|nr:sensor domain-containing diguanylate cyclase [Methylophaga sp.]